MLTSSPYRYANIIDHNPRVVLCVFSPNRDNVTSVPIMQIQISKEMNNVII